MMKQTRRMAVDMRSGAQEAVNTYMSSLADLTVNSKPHINALTMLAEDYLNYADAIVKAVDDHLQKVPSSVKLPILYLIDSIIKNVGKVYITLFSRNIVQSFSTVFEQVDEKTRQQMYKLRQTWNEIFPEEHLYAMDVKVSSLDPKWPITASPASQYVAATPSQAAPLKIHINPKFLQTNQVATPVASTPSAGGGEVSSPLPATINTSVPQKPVPAQPQVSAPPNRHPDDEALLLEQLMQRKRNLLQLQQEKEQFRKKKALSKLLEKEETCVTSVKEKIPDLPAVLHPKSEEIIMIKEVPPKSPEVPKAEVRLKEPAIGVSQVPSNVPRIAPVRTGLVNLVASQRAQRDPRLSKQPKEVVVIEDSIKPQAKTRDPRLTAKAEKRSRSSEKESSSKMVRHRSRETSADRSSSSRHSSRREEREKRSSDRKPSRKSEDRTASKSKKTSSRSPSKSSSSRSPSKTSNSRSPRKSASSRSPSKPSKSSVKHERRKDSSSSPRKSYSGHRPVSDVADSPESDGSDSKDNASASSGPSSSDWSVNFTKGSYKSRNYVRRNLPEKSPEVVGPAISTDVDLRVNAVQDKEIQSSNSDRLLLSSSTTLPTGVPEQILPTIACQDVDLRCLSSSPGKKRRSAEPEDGHPPMKKNKAAHMEMLFGKQDVDLRQMDLGNGMASDAPSPPPPPIISSPELGAMLKDPNLGWSKFKQTHSPSPTGLRSPAFPRSSRHDRLGHSSGISELDQREDTDMRNPINGLEASKPDFEGILKQATEQYHNGTMSHADYDQIRMRVFRMHETAKIREAQRNDYSRRDGWERRPKEKDYRHGLASPDTENYGDIDERYQAPVKKPLLPLPGVPPVALQDGRHPRHMSQRMPGPMQGQGYGRPSRSILGGGPRPPPRGSWRYSRGGAGLKDSTITLPPADQFILDKIAHDPMKTITIDNIAREIRFYGINAVAMMSADDPREIAFDPGEANVMINEVNICCSFNEPAKEVIINGETYRVHLGAPTRELYINDEGFECQFNCPPKEILLATGELFTIQLQSDEAPKVHVGMQRRDLVAGRVMLIIDAEICIPIFLDAKPQRFDIDGVPHVIKFADSLDTVLINNRPFNIKFGGPAVPITVNSLRHYIRLTELPPGVTPGEVDIVSMTNHYRKSSRAAGAGAGAGAAGAQWGGSGPGSAPTSQATNLTRNLDTDHEPVLPVQGGLPALSRPGMPKKINKSKGRRDPTESLKPARVEERQMPPEMFQALQPALLGLLPGSKNTGYNSTPSATSGAFGLRQNIGAGSATGTESATSTSITSSSSTFPSRGPEATASTGSNGIPFIQPDLNIHKLLQSLYDTGLIAKKDSKVVKEEKDIKKIHEVDFKDPKSLKVNQPAIIDILYSGIQCSSCGTRFPPEQTEKYSAHLDWHFRQNRRDKDSQRKPQSRKWYYDVSDWIQFEEIDDTLDKAQNWFDTQQTETAKFEEVEEEEVQSVPSKDFAEGTICELCHDKFDQFYNEDKEEWHLKDCLVADGLPYHPFCYKDYRVSVESKDEEQTDDVEDEDKMDTSENPETSGVEVKKESEESNDKIIKEEKSDVDVKIEKVEDTENSEQEKPVSDESSNTVVIKQEILDGEPSDNAEEGACDTTEVRCESSEVENQIDESAGQENEGTEEENQGEVNKEEDAEKKDSQEGVSADSEDTAVAAEVADKAEALDEADIQEEPKTLQEKLLHDPITDTTSAVVSCSIDGNLELAQAPPTLPTIPNRIKINIQSKPVVKPIEETKDVSDKEEEESGGEGQDSLQQDPSDEKPIVLKPKLLGRKLKEMPPMRKGSETSGLCSVM